MGWWDWVDETHDIFIIGDLASRGLSVMLLISIGNREIEWLGFVDGIIFAATPADERQRGMQVIGDVCSAAWRGV